MYKKIGLLLSVVGLTACSTVMQSLPAIDYWGYYFSGRTMVEDSYFGGQSQFDTTTSRGSRMSSLEKQYQANALKNDQEYPLSFAGIFSRPSAGAAPSIDLTGNWREVGDRAVQMVNRYSYSDLKAAMKNQNPSDVSLFLENQKGGVNTGICIEKALESEAARHYNSEARESIAAEEWCQKILLKQSYDLEKIKGASLLAKMFAAKEYVNKLYSASYGMGKRSEGELLVVQREVLETTKRGMALAVLFKAYEDANRLDSKGSAYARPYKAEEEIDRYGVARLKNKHENLSGYSRRFTNIAADPWFSTVSGGGLIGKPFEERVCRMIPMDYMTMAQLFDMRDEKRYQKRIDITKGANGTFLSDPFKFGAREFHLIISPERTNGFAGNDEVKYSVNSCLKIFQNKLLKDPLFYKLIIPPMPGRGTGGGGWLHAEMTDRGAPGPSMPDLTFTKKQLAVLRSYLEKHLENAETMRTSYKMQ